MRRILVAVDGSPRSLRVLDAGLRLALESDARLKLVHIVHLPLDFPSALWAERGASLEEQVIALGREVVSELAKEVPKDRLAGTAVKIGTPWKAICELAKEFDADLVIIGAHGYGLLDRTLGTTAANVVNHADRDVLVVRERSK